jgi:hypothetical protein
MEELPMKKVLALVLAVMMLSTMAFAIEISNSSNDGNATVSNNGNEITITGGNFKPGDKIYIYKLDSATDEDVKEVNTTNYSLTKVKYDEGKSLVDDIYFDDDNDQLVIKLAANDNLTTTKTLKVTFTLKGKGRETKDINVTIDTTVGYKYAKNAYVLYDVDDVRLLSSMTAADEQLKDTFYGVVTEKVDAASTKPAYADWTFYPKADKDVEIDVRIYDGDKLYLYNTADADKDILKAYADSDADLSFLKFPNTTFNSTAKVYFYKDEDSFIYEIKNGKLVESNAKWDDDEGCFILKTRTLGNYVFSDVDLDVTEDVDDTTENPDTGANDVVGIAAALGAVALVSAAAVSLKK